MADFQIIEATKKGFQEAWADKTLLLKKAVPTILIHWVSFYFLSLAISFKENPAPEEVPYVIDYGLNFYLGIGLYLVAMIALSYLFIFQARMLLQGDSQGEPVDLMDADRAEAGPVSDSYNPVRRAYILGVGIILGFFLFRQALGEVSVFFAAFLAQYGTFVTFAFALAYGVILIWLFRFGVLHIPAAINYPLKDFLYKVRGFRFSFYLIGLMVCVLVPFSFGAMAAGGILIQIVNMIHVGLTFPFTTAILALGYVVAFTILNGASIYAVDEVMRKANEETADENGDV